MKQTNKQRVSKGQTREATLLLHLTGDSWPVVVGLTLIIVFFFLKTTFASPSSSLAPLCWSVSRVFNFDFFFSLLVLSHSFSFLFFRCFARASMMKEERKTKKRVNLQARVSICFSYYVHRNTHVSKRRACVRVCICTRWRRVFL